MNRLIYCFLMAFFTLFVACNTHQSHQSQHKSAPTLKVSWHQEGMESALKLAKKENRPLFVYWGAVWCPPCNVIKSNVFTHPAFIEATQSYVSVYLDGDSKEAQMWGEKLQASGYPTLMVLNPKGKEVARLSKSMTPHEFAETLQSLNSRMDPIEEVVAHALRSSEPVDLKTWQRIANYSWSQRSGFENDPIDQIDTFEKLERKIPEQFKVEKSKISLLSLVTKIQNSKKKLNPEQRTKGRALLESILSSRELTSANSRSLSYWSSEILSALFTEKQLTPDKRKERAQLVQLYKKAILRLRAQKDLTTYDQLATYFPLVEIQKVAPEFALSDAEKKKIHSDIQAFLGGIKDEKAHVYVLNASSYILRESGLLAEAKKMLFHYLPTSPSPYYFMYSLGSIEKKEGNPEAALEWFRKAYDTSKGKATRLQWGSTYLTNLIELFPTETAKIFEEVKEFYEEHLKTSDAFMGRNKKRLKRLADSIDKWSTEVKTRKELKPIVAELGKNCSRNLPIVTPSYIKTCETYFGKIGS